MFCVKCGAQLDDNAIFCPKCGNKVGEVSATASASPEVIVKSKRECIYDAVCRFLRATPQYLTGATFSDFEVYEEGQEGKIYVEIIASNRNMFGQTKATRFGAVIRGRTLNVSPSMDGIRRMNASAPNTSAYNSHAPIFLRVPSTAVKL